MLTCNTRVGFALEEDDLKLVSGKMGDVATEMKKRIPKLAKGTAIVSSSSDIMRHPALLKIRKRQTREGAPTPNMAEEVKKWRDRQEF